MSSFTETKWPPSKSLPGGGAGTATTPAPPVPMKLFGAWEVDKTPANCIPRLCTVTINKLILTKEALPDVSSLVIAVKMQSSKRTLRSNEISLTQSPTLLTSTSTTTITTTTSQYHHHPSTTQNYQSRHQRHMPSCPASAASLTSDVSSNTAMESSISMATGHVTTSPISASSTIVTTATGSSTTTTTTSPPLVSCNCIQVDLDLTFALQYPHFLKKSGNQLQILLQRRKRYKNRAILGFKTLAGGVINMAEVLQRSQVGERELDLRENISLKDKDKESSRKDHSIQASKSSEVIGKIIMSSLKSQPVDHDVTANGSSGVPGTGRNLKPLNESADMDSDEEVDEFSASDGSDSDEGNARRGVKGFNKWRRHIKSKSHHHHRHGRSSHPVESSAVGVHDRRNFKQKVIALLKKFKIPDSEASDSEEPEAALDNPDMLPEIGNIDDIFEFEDSDVDSTQDFDDFSISSTPRPGLKPFFSSKSTLVEENEPSCGKTGGGRIGSGHSSEERDDRFPVYTSSRSGRMVMTSSPKPSLRPFFSSSKSTIASGQHDPEADTEPIDSSGTEHTPDTSDTSLKQTLESADTSSKVKSSSHHQASHHKEGKESKSKSSKHHQQTSKEQSQHQQQPSKSDRGGGTGGGAAGSGGKNVKDTLKNLLRK